MDSGKTRTGVGDALSTSATAPLKPKPGLNGPPAQRMPQRAGWEIDPFERVNRVLSSKIPKVTPTAVIQADPGGKQRFCSDQADKAALEAILPYGHVLLGGDYRPSAVVGGTAEVANDRLIDAAAGSTWFLRKVRSWTRMPMTMTSKVLKGAGWVTTALSGYQAVSAMQREYKACMEQ